MTVPIAIAAGPSRPLRGIGALVASYAVARAAVVWWPVPPLAAPVFAEASRDAAELVTAYASADPDTHHPEPMLMLKDVVNLPAIRDRSSVRFTDAAPRTSLVVAGVPGEPAPAPAAIASDPPAPVRPLAYAAAPVHATPRDRIGGSIFLGIRGASGGGLGVPSLGGDQVGARGFVPLGRGFAATARISTPLRGPGADIAFGVAWRARHGGVIVEQRLALADGRTTGTAVIGYRGIDAGVGKGWRVDGYVQGGAVVQTRVRLFADARATLDHPVAVVGPVRVAAGATMAASAQPGSARVDIGPDLIVRGAIAGRGYRLALGWRSRVAGNAAPGSGPSLGLGVDF